MIKKYCVLLGILLSLSFLLRATVVYPGGSLDDIHSVGFQWSQNFISNLFATRAVNGALNPSRLWADIAMFFLTASFGLFFIGFSKKLPNKGVANVVGFLGTIGMVCTFLIATPLHDVMVTIASTLFLVSLFYITVFILKTRLLLFKIACIACLVIFYLTLFLYGSGKFIFLPIMQKVALFSVIILVLGLEYFTTKEDFMPSAKEAAESLRDL